MNSIKSLFYIIVLLVISISGCVEKEVVTTGAISGVVYTRANQSGISGVTIYVDESRYVTTNTYGYFTVTGLESGIHTVRLVKDGYRVVEDQIKVVGKTVEVEYELVYTGSPIDPEEPEEPEEPEPSNKAVTRVAEYITISDGAYYYFNPSANTKFYYFSTLTVEEAANSDNEIIENLLLNAPKIEVEKDSNEGYSWSLSESTEYVICLLSVDYNGQFGELTKTQISTKSSRYQPQAFISITGIDRYSSTVDATFQKNSYCTHYVMLGWLNVEAKMENPDIYWAAYCYERLRDNSQDDIYSSNHSTTFVNIPEGWHVLTTLGYNSDNNGGIINKEFFTMGNTSYSLSRSSVSKPQGIMDTKIKGEKIKPDFIRVIE